MTQKQSTDTRANGKQKTRNTQAKREAKRKQNTSNTNKTQSKHKQNTTRITRASCKQNTSNTHKQRTSITPRETQRKTQAQRKQNATIPQPPPNPPPPTPHMDPQGGGASPMHGGGWGGLNHIWPILGAHTWAFWHIYRILYGPYIYIYIYIYLYVYIYIYTKTHILPISLHMYGRHSPHRHQKQVIEEAADELSERRKLHAVEQARGMAEVERHAACFAGAG